MAATGDRVLPTIDRTDAELVVVGDWEVDAPQRHTAAVDAAADQWAFMPWPNGLLSHTAYAGEDGSSVLHYSQAAKQEGFDNFARAKDEWLHGIDAAVSGITRLGARAYQRKGSVRTGQSGHPGCIAVVTFATDSTGTATGWIERLISTAGNEAAPPGMLAAHFHVSLDGQRLINYAEWINAEAHQRATGQDRHQRPAAAEVVDQTQGVQFMAVKRYLYWRSMHA